MSQSACSRASSARFRTGLTRNQLLELTRRENDDTIKAPLQRLSGLISDLQDAVMRARMQPVGRLFGGLPRLVREVAAEVGKKIHLVTEGAETALDRQLIDHPRSADAHDPQLRGAWGRGPPSKDLRMASQKPVRSVSVLRMKRPDHDQCRRRWPRSGYSAHSTESDCARPRQGGRSRAHEQWRFAALIFAPGFSTAATSVSGRGRHGCGARKYRGDRRLHLALFHAWPRHFSIKIPLTLAIAPALIVQAGNHRFCSAAGECRRSRRTGARCRA